MTQEAQMLVLFTIPWREWRVSVRVCPFRLFRYRKTNTREFHN